MPWLPASLDGNSLIQAVNMHPEVTKMLNTEILCFKEKPLKHTYKLSYSQENVI